MVHIYAVHMSGGVSHAHIAAVKWKNPDTSESGQNSKAEMVSWINGGGAVYVCGGGHLARVLIVQAHPPYLRTHADGVWTDNLLALPRF